MLAEEAVLC